MTPYQEDVLAVIAALEPGGVMTYGEIALEAGHPGSARAISAVLKAVENLPWWRVVASNGRLIPGHEADHAQRLRSEGVTVIGGRVSMGAKA
jgi:methylated-DNA-protein-cysteine methyltransferase-like protein